MSTAGYIVLYTRPVADGLHVPVDVTIYTEREYAEEEAAEKNKRLAVRQRRLRFVVFALVAETEPDE